MESMIGFMFSRGYRYILGRYYFVFAYVTGPEGGLNGTLSPAVEIFVPTAGAPVRGLHTMFVVPPYKFCQNYQYIVHDLLESMVELTRCPLIVACPLDMWGYVFFSLD